MTTNCISKFEKLTVAGTGCGARFERLAVVQLAGFNRNQRRAHRGRSQRKVCVTTGTKSARSSDERTQTVPLTESPLNGVRVMQDRWAYSDQEGGRCTSSPG
jgi:hypothetical protein